MRITLELRMTHAQYKHFIADEEAHYQMAFGAQSEPHFDVLLKVDDVYNIDNETVVVTLFGSSHNEGK